MVQELYPFEYEDEEPSGGSNGGVANGQAPTNIQGLIGWTQDEDDIHKDEAVEIPKVDAKTESKNIIEALKPGAKKRKADELDEVGLEGEKENVDPATVKKRKIGEGVDPATIKERQIGEGYGLEKYPITTEW